MPVHVQFTCYAHANAFLPYAQQAPSRQPAHRQHLTLHYSVLDNPGSMQNASSTSFGMLCCLFRRPACNLRDARSAAAVVTRPFDHLVAASGSVLERLHRVHPSVPARYR